jgi:hypothetical protein
MFKKIVEFFTGKKTAPEVVAPGGAPYKVETPAATASGPGAVPIPYRYNPPAATPDLHVYDDERLVSKFDKQKESVVAPAKKPRKPAVKKSAVVSAPAEKKPARSKKTTK